VCVCVCVCDPLTYQSAHIVIDWLKYDLIYWLKFDTREYVSNVAREFRITLVKHRFWRTNNRSNYRISKFNRIHAVEAERMWLWILSCRTPGIYLSIKYFKDQAQGQSVCTPIAATLADLAFIPWLISSPCVCISSLSGRMEHGLAWSLGHVLVVLARPWELGRWP